jgi:hypothetical protein
MKLSLIGLSFRLWPACCLILALGAPALAETLFEDFNDNSLDPTLWTVDHWGTGPSLVESNQQLEIDFPGSSSGTDFGCKLASNFLLRGDFDLQVEFRLLNWPFGNGVRLGLGMDEIGVPQHPGVERVSFGQSDYPGWPRESYTVDFPDGVHGITGTDDMVGRLRLIRSGSSQSGFYDDSGNWVFIGTGPATTADVAIKLAAWSAYQFMNWDVFAAFDNLTVNSAQIIWPVIPVQETSWGRVKALYR